MPLFLVTVDEFEYWECGDLFFFCFFFPMAYLHSVVVVCLDKKDICIHRMRIEVHVKNMSLRWIIRGLILLTIYVVGQWRNSVRAS